MEKVLKYNKLQIRLKVMVEYGEGKSRLQYWFVFVELNCVQ